MPSQQYVRDYSSPEAKLKRRADIHLIRGMIGKEGSGILQMNSEPSGQNIFETGCTDG
jgi:hypothetical protein